MAVANAERQAAWRERRRAEGLTTDPYRGPRKSRALPWCFIDTEGATDEHGVYGDPGRQWTFCITAAADDGYTASLCENRPLRTTELLFWLLGLPRQYKYGGFFFRYDIDQILADWPAERLRRIHGSGGRDAGPTSHGRYLIEVFNGKLTVVAPSEKVKDPREIGKLKGRRRVVWDVGRFYQSSLLAAIDVWEVAQPSERAIIETMKTQRSAFTVKHWQQSAANAQRIVDYSILENRLAARLQGRFDKTAAELGYPLRSWYGAGSLAKSILTHNGTQAQLKQRRPLRRWQTERNDFALALPYAYFGGRFEIREPGEIAAPVYEYDLRSAYPASYRQLPCVEHGEWRLAKSFDEIGPHDLCRASWQIPGSDIWGPFPTRDSGSRIYYPQSGSGLVWGVEMNAALQMWRRSTGHLREKGGIWPDGGWQYLSHCDCEPFAWIDEAYAQRVALGKARKGWALKLGLNAIYGTFASALGAAFDGANLTGEYGDFTWCEPRWAGLITAWSRARLLDAMHAAGGPRSPDTLMFATDAIYSTAPIPLDLEDRLGGWEAHEYEGGLLVQPGVYHLKGQPREEKLRGRGVEFRDFQSKVGAFYTAWRAKGADASVEIKLSPRYLGTRLMLHRNNIEGAYRWVTESRRLSFDPSIKREWRHGKWLPRTVHSENPFDLPGHPHPRFEALMRGETYMLSEDDLAALEETMKVEALPDGPFA